MLNKIIKKSSRVFRDINGRVCIENKNVRVQNVNFDPQNSTLIDSTQAKKLDAHRCDSLGVHSPNHLAPSGTQILRSSLAIFKRAMQFGEMDDVRFYANGTALIGGQNSLVCSNAQVLFKAPLSHTSSETILIPHTLLDAMIKTCGTNAIAVFSVHRDTITIECNGFIGQAPIISGHYPPYQSAFPQKIVHSVNAVKNEEDEIKLKRVSFCDENVNLNLSVENVNTLKKTGFPLIAQVENVNRPVLFTDGSGCEALVVPIRF
jgi:hypothetical protein